MRGNTIPIQDRMRQGKNIGLHRFIEWMAIVARVAQ